MQFSFSVQDNLLFKKDLKFTCSSCKMGSLGKFPKFVERVLFSAILSPFFDPKNLNICSIFVAELFGANYLYFYLWKNLWKNLAKTGKKAWINWGNSREKSREKLLEKSGNFHKTCVFLLQKPWEKLGNLVPFAKKIRLPCLIWFVCGEKLRQSWI